MDIKNFFFGMIYEILDAILNYQRNGSGWYFEEVLSLEIHTVKYKPLKGSTFIPPTDFIMRKKAVINLKNKDDRKCFIWSILRYLDECKDKHSVEIRDLKQYENELNFEGIDFPVKIKDIKQFEN